jgi:hypothetical protein
VVTTDDEYRKDRRTTQAWNDAWGNPLLVSYALFQPERFSRVFDGQNRRDLLLHGAMTAYKYNRSIYLAAGAIGPTIRDRTKLDALAASTAASGDAPVLRALWTQVRECCKAYDWTERSFDQPPWKGVRNLSTAGERCFLTSPLELH